MARKKKVSENAIDKYLKQVRYRSELKKNKAEKAKYSGPKVVLPRIKSRRLREIIKLSNLDDNQVKVIDVKVSIVKLQPISDLCKTNTSVPSTRKTSQLKNLEKNGSNKSKVCDKKAVRKIICSKPVPKPNITKRNLRKRKIVSEETNTKARPVGRVSKANEKNEKVKSVERLTREKDALPSFGTRKISEKKKIIENSKRPRICKNTIDSSSFKKQSIPATSVKNKRNSSNVQKPKKSGKITNISPKSRSSSPPLANRSSVNESQLSENLNEEESTINHSEITSNEPEISESVESSRINFSSNGPCLCEPINFDSNDATDEKKENSIPAKYRKCMDELKSLTPDVIKKYIEENEQYYLEFRRAQSAFHRKKGNKKIPDETKDAFKCYPFDSSQQIAMYLALRQIFKIPNGSFLECRYFFTLLMPEICLQLFAKIFQVKKSFAPRLIKKLYPQSACPV